MCAGHGYQNYNGDTQETGTEGEYLQDAQSASSRGFLDLSTAMMRKGFAWSYPVVRPVIDRKGHYIPTEPEIGCR
jgi:hypothetical protein